MLLLLRRVACRHVNGVICTWRWCRATDGTMARSFFHLIITNCASTWQYGRREMSEMTARVVSGPSMVKFVENKNFHSSAAAAPHVANYQPYSSLACVSLGVLFFGSRAATDR